MDGENGAVALAEPFKGEPIVVGEWGPDNPWPGLDIGDDKATTGYEITMSIAYCPETGAVHLAGNYRGGADGRMLLELAAERIQEAFPKP